MVKSTAAARYHHGDLRQALFDAALTLLDEGGADALSLREVARRAGVSPRAPYRHYADKEALLSAVAVFGFTELRDALVEADHQAAPARALEAQAGAYVRYALANPALFRLMFGPKRSGVHPELAAAKAASYGVLAGRVAAGAVPGGDREARALGCWSLVHGLALLLLDGRAGDEIAAPEDEIVRRVAAAMLRAELAP